MEARASPSWQTGGPYTRARTRSNATGCASRTSRPPNAGSFILRPPSHFATSHRIPVSDLVTDHWKYGTYIRVTSPNHKDASLCPVNGLPMNERGERADKGREKHAVSSKKERNVFFFLLLMVRSVCKSSFTCTISECRRSLWGSTHRQRPCGTKVDVK